MKTRKKDPLNTKVSPGTYLLCLLISFVSTVVTFAFGLVTGLGIALSNGYTGSYLESENFIQKHQEEHLTIMVFNYLKQFFDSYFGVTFVILLAAMFLLVILMWFAARKNAYAFVKFQAAVTACSSLLMILLPVLLMIIGVHSSVELANPQNTLLFSAYIKSALFILIAIGVAMMALAFLAEFAAATITKKRKEAYIARQKSI